MRRRTTDWRRLDRPLDRRIGEREQKQRFLIVCEGTETEPNYFKSFPIPPDLVDLRVQGVGCTPSGVVDEATKIRDEVKESDDPYDQVWCVFDRDAFPRSDFFGAIQTAKDRGIYVACSDEAFELWYLLHFDYVSTAVARTDYSRRLEEVLGHAYSKNSKTMYRELQAWQAVAVRNAKKRLEWYASRGLKPENPYTTVHLLVIELNKYCR